jgi:hypothetical protein
MAITNSFPGSTFSAAQAAKAAAPDESRNPFKASLCSRRSENTGSYHPAASFGPVERRMEIFTYSGFE